MVDVPSAASFYLIIHKYTGGVVGSVVVMSVKKKNYVHCLIQIVYHFTWHIVLYSIDHIYDNRCSISLNGSVLHCYIAFVIHSSPYISHIDR
jgi:phage-related holin